MVLAGIQAEFKNDQTRQSKLVILTSNCPALRKSEVEYCAILAKTGIHHYHGNNIKLGTTRRNYQSVHTGYH